MQWQNLGLLLCAAVFMPACATGLKSDAKPNFTKSEISEIYKDFGTSALASDDLPRAIENLRIAIDYNKDNAVAHNNLGLALLGMGKKDEAKTEFMKAMDIDPKYSDPVVNLGTWHFSAGNRVKAREYYRKALDNLEYKRRFQPLASLGHLELLAGNLQEAKKNLFEALNQNPNYCLAHMLLGKVYERENRLDKAVDSYKNSIKGDCIRNVESQMALGSIYSRLQDYQKARAQYHQVMEQFPHTAYAEKASKTIRELP